MNDEKDTVLEQEQPEQEQPEQEQEQEAPAITDEDVLAALESPSAAVKAALDKLIAAAVKKALAGATPKRGTVKSDPITKQDFARMTYKQRCELYESNRPLYDKLKGEL